MQEDSKAASKNALVAFAVRTKAAIGNQFGAALERAGSAATDGLKALHPNQIDTVHEKALTVVTDGISWAYDQIIDQGVPGLPGAEKLAADHRKAHADPEHAIDNLIAWQVGYAGTAGFITGLPGLIALPATLTVDLVSVLYIQLRMIAAIAHLRGYDIRSEQVRVMAYACLVGQSATKALSEIGVKVGTKGTQRLIAQISGSTLTSINRAVGYRLITKAGSTGVVNLSKIVPVVGGLVSGGFDAAATAAVGAAAKSIFISIAQIEPIPAAGADSSAVGPQVRVGVQECGLSQVPLRVNRGPSENTI